MTLVNIIQVTVLDNPTAFTNPFQFEITFECLQELQDGAANFSEELVSQLTNATSYHFLPLTLPILSRIRSRMESDLCRICRGCSC